MRLKLTTELLKDANFLKDEHIVIPRIATDEELALIHQYDYIQAIRHASHGILVNTRQRNMDSMDDASLKTYIVIALGL